MAWVWWLSAPVIATVLAALVAWWCGRRSGLRVRDHDPIRSHQNLLSALAGPSSTLPVPPANLVVLPAAVE
jgi:hypothetical protein